MTFVHNAMTGEDLELDVLSVSRVRQLTGKTDKTFKSWVDKGVMPAPIYEGIDRPDHRYYSIDEVIVIRDTLLRNTTNSRFLKVGTETVSELFNSITRVRG